MSKPYDAKYVPLEHAGPTHRCPPAVPLADAHYNAALLFLFRGILCAHCSPTPNPYTVASGPYTSSPYGATAHAPGAVHGAKEAHQIPDAFAAPGSGLAVSSSNYIESMEKSVRMGFVRKVYAILAVQLLITFGITFLFCFNDTCVVRSGVGFRCCLLMRWGE